MANRLGSSSPLPWLSKTLDTALAQMGPQISSTLAMQDKSMQAAPPQGDQSDTYDEFSRPRRGFMSDACRAYEHPLVGSLRAPKHGEFSELNCIHFVTAASAGQKAGFL